MKNPNDSFNPFDSFSQEEKNKFSGCSDFLKFLEQNSDRTSFITDYLEEKGVKTSVINMNGKKHIHINFDKSQYSGYFRIKTLIAHYDRIPGTEGANDNSFAVFEMMRWAVSLSRKNIQHNIRMIFTDGEEFSEKLSFSEKFSIEEQGAFDLAGTFRRLGITEDDVYVFDCMGRGTVPVLQKEPFLRTAKDGFRKKFNALYERARKTLENAADGKYVTLPVSWSDNAGFIASGIPAVLITMLPKEEASLYLMNLAKNPGLEEFVVNRKSGFPEETEKFISMIPETWHLINSEKDKASTLTNESGKVFEKILDEIADEKILP